MAAQTLILNVPATLYDQLTARAAQSRRSLEEETLDLLSIAVPNGVRLPIDLAEDLASLALLDDEGLQRASGNRLADEALRHLEDLHIKRQRGGLTTEEEQARAALVRQYERAMLVRAEAVAELRRRGHPAPVLTLP